MAREALRDAFFKEYRLAIAESGLSRKEIADYLGVTPHVLTSWVTGVRRMTIGLARQMVRPLKGRIHQEQLNRVIVAAVSRIVSEEFGASGFSVTKVDALKLFGEVK